MKQIKIALLAFFLGLPFTSYAETQGEKAHRVKQECEVAIVYATQALLNIDSKMAIENKEEPNWLLVTDVTDKLNKNMISLMRKSSDLNDQERLDIIRINNVSQQIIQTSYGTLFAVGRQTALKVFHERCLEKMGMFKRTLAR